MKFVSLRKEVLKVLEMAEYQPAKISISRTVCTGYSYNHSLVIVTNPAYMHTSDVEEIAKYVNDHPHISKVIFPYSPPPIENIILHKLQLSDFFTVVNRKIRIILGGIRNKNMYEKLDLDYRYYIHHFNFDEGSFGYNLNFDKVVVNCSFNTINIIRKGEVKYTINKRRKNL